MAVGAQLYKEVMSRWTTGITVITAVGADHWEGVTVNSFCSVSLTPPLVLISVDQKLSLHAAIEHAAAYAVNLLTSQQLEWGKRFAGMLPDVTDRFAGISCQTAVTGCPLLPDTLGWFDCQVHDSLSGGDHTIFVGEVVAAAALHDNPPLAYHGRHWGGFTPVDANP